jgi:hypothetical protein
MFYDIFENLILAKINLGSTAGEGSVSREEAEMISQ